MGLLTLGEPLSWEETKKHANHIRKHGILQFLNIYHARKDRVDEYLKWGDEIEYMVLRFDNTNKKVRVSLRAEELLAKLQEPENAGLKTISLWRPEFGAYMVEGTPGLPYGLHRSPVEQMLMAHVAENSDSDGSDDSLHLDDVVNDLPEAVTVPSKDLNGLAIFEFLNDVEENMKYRRNEVRSLLEPDEILLTISTFPTLGTFDFTSPGAFCTPTAGPSRSLFFPDKAIFQGHPRFQTLVNNIRERRGKNVSIQVPIYRDTDTPTPFFEDYTKSMNVDPANEANLDTSKKVAAERPRSANILKNQIYMDAMGFGMGCSCLQVTFQAANLREARLLYDQLTPLTPILMAMTAGSPAFRGLLSDLDCRWAVISGSVDDRTTCEINGVDQKTGKRCKQIPKSRFDSVDLYILPEHDVYNDLPVVLNEKAYEMLINDGVDSLLAKHIAHLFIRDPLVVFKEKLDIDDATESDHFENIQSTNWQTMRFKPPPPNAPEIGWRVEFRPMEVQVTDFENAALVVFIILLSRLILSFNLNLLIPISKVEDNMKIAQERDALLKKNFWFRTNITLPKHVVRHFARCKPRCIYTRSLSKKLSPSKVHVDSDPESPSVSDSDSPPSFTSSSGATTQPLVFQCGLMSINDIINGTRKEDGSVDFPGLVPLLHFYMDSMEVNVNTRCRLNAYLRFISDRASGESPTLAHIMRNYIKQHPSYRHDSVVSDEISYDLLKQLSAVNNDFEELKKIFR